jgi:calmodulin-regulated spectrin-associated protein
MHALANAELYCLALAHIYSDPNYSQLNHWGVIQALARKGVYVAEPSDVALTETTLIHTSPFRMVSFLIIRNLFFFFKWKIDNVVLI